MTGVLTRGGQTERLGGRDFKAARFLHHIGALGLQRCRQREGRLHAAVTLDKASRGRADKNGFLAPDFMNGQPPLGQPVGGQPQNTVNAGKAVRVGQRLRSKRRVGMHGR